VTLNSGNTTGGSSGKLFIRMRIMDRAARRRIKLQKRGAGLHDLRYCLKERLHNNIAIEDCRVHELAWRLVEVDLAL
jgi:hypothetical protein